MDENVQKQLSQRIAVLIEKFNPYHDRLGRFTTASRAGGAGGESSQLSPPLPIEFRKF